MLKASARIPDISRALRQEGQRLEKEHKRAAIEAAEIASFKAYRHTQAAIRAAGLGNLAKQVGHTSTKRKNSGDNGKAPYGVIYSKGGDDNRGGSALESYSRGAFITAKNGGWLALPARAAPKFVTVGGKRRRLTPALWHQAGLTKKIGELKFRLLNPNKAILYVRGTTLDPRTGRAKAAGKSAPRARVDMRKRDVVVFVLIKRTFRLKRFDQHGIVERYASRVPDYLRRILAGYTG